MIWGFVLAFITALILISFTRKESEMRNCQLSGYVFAVLFLASIFLHSFNSEQVVTVLVLLSYFPLFSSFEVQNPATSSFVSFLQLGLAALIFPPVKWLVPFYWIGLVMLRAFGLKSLLASVFGVVIPWLWVFALESAGLQIPYIHHCFSFKMPLGGYGVMTTYKWIMTTGIILLFIYSSGLFRRIAYLAKSKTRVMYQVITLFASATVLFMVVSPTGFMVWYPLSLLNVSLIFSRMVDKNI